MSEIASRDKKIFRKLHEKFLKACFKLTDSKQHKESVKLFIFAVILFQFANVCGNS